MNNRMQLLYGTFNPAKLASMKRKLTGTGIELVGLMELPQPPMEADETGHSMRENARIKAQAYRDATGQTVLSADSGLFLTGVSQAEQPAEHPRRMLGERMDDEAMIRFFADIAEKNGGRIRARYRNALCIAFADGRIKEVWDDSVASRAFYIVSRPHPKRTPGFPLDSLSIDERSGQYYYDMDQQRIDDELAHAEGYRAFILSALKGEA